MAGVVKAMDSALASMNLEKVVVFFWSCLFSAIFFYSLPGYSNHGEI
jgi:hypothetical protein